VAILKVNKEVDSITVFVQFDVQFLSLHKLGTPNCKHIYLHFQKIMKIYISAQILFDICRNME
jgi:hypothetical protein